MLPTPTRRKRNKTSNTSSSLTPPKPSSPSHGEEIIDDILLQFDLNPVFGPCRGLTRTQRLQRAQKLSLNPPSNVANILASLKKVETSEQSVLDAHCLI
jgi:DNA polymerase delta, subunit 4